MKKTLAKIGVVAIVALTTGAAGWAQATNTASSAHHAKSELPDISTGWKIRMGDDPSWKQASHDDAAWTAIQTAKPWEAQGFTNYDGYAWYRIHFRVPAALQQRPEFRRHRALRIELGKIDDVDQTWFNGQPIGATGNFPDAYEPAWLASRSYLIPDHLIRWDADNVVAIRVYDGNGEGGMYEGSCRLAFADWTDLIRMTFDFGKANGITTNSKPVPLVLRLNNGTTSVIEGELAWRISTDSGMFITNLSAPASVPPAGERTFKSGFLPPAPGFYRVSCTFRVDRHSFTNTAAVTVGFRPEAIQSSLSRQPDFGEFWRTTLARLAAIPPEFGMARRPAMDSPTHEVYEVSMRSLGGVRVGGWYEKPKAPGAHPALIRVPGYGQNMQPTGWAEPLAILSFNVRGHGNSQQDVKGTPPDFWIRGLDDKEGYYYQGAYADCVRAVDFLVTRPEVDAKRIGITGASQGGGLSLATAALDARIRFCAPDIPFLCDWNTYSKLADWTEVGTWINANRDRSPEGVLRTLSYFDTLNLADRIRCPVFLGIGLQDETCPPATIFSVYNRIPSPKEYRVYPLAHHWVGATHDSERMDWIRARLDEIR